MIRARLGNAHDLVPLWDHLQRHDAESGCDGDLIFSPGTEASQAFDLFCVEKEEKWARPPTTLGWERCWILENDEQILGSLRLLNHFPMPSTLHRAILMMGLERAARARGFGRLLMSHALEWARSTPTLDWVQLYVFAHNRPAIGLYESFGFRPVGFVRDLFRIDGHSVTDVEMVLQLRERLNL